MNAVKPISDPASVPNPPTDAVIKLAVMAVGGQGGGVLAGWIERLARAEGWAVQATSVAGVAQRTGATIYYLEMAPLTQGRAAIFALAPSAGDVDILIAAEMMEAGRAIQRGFVTPDRTLLIGSTHRALAVSEKMVPGDGIASAEEVRAAAEIAARTLVLADFEQAAVAAGSVISASLFGALAGSGVLPFPRAAFEAAIRAAGKGVEASLRAFSAGFEAAQAGVQPAAGPAAPANPPPPRGPGQLLAGWSRLEACIDSLPAPTRAMAMAGLRKVVGFQDIAYGAAYLERVERVLAADHAEQGWELTRQGAKYIANAMAYDDVIRVADEKTKAGRLARIRTEMGGAEVMQLTEYTHPRAEEIISLLPARLGHWINARPRLVQWIDRRVNRGRRLRTDRLWPFVQLWLIAGLRGWRLVSLRHETEMAHLEAWLATALDHAAVNYDLGVGTLAARRLVKGYSDTHARGLSKFDKVMAATALLRGRDDAADWTRRLVTAALADEEGDALDGAIRTIRSF